MYSRLHASSSSQGLKTRAGLDKALGDVAEFLRQVPATVYFRGDRDFDQGAER